MCLGIPGRIVDVYERHGTRLGKVDFEGIAKEICLSFVPDAEVGDYTIVHTGFAISKIDEESAHDTLALMKEMGVFETEMGRASTADGSSVAGE